MSVESEGPLPRDVLVRIALRAAALFASAASFIWFVQLQRWGSLHALDLEIHAWIVGRRTPVLTEIAINFTALGSATLLTVATILVTILLWTSRRRLAALDAALASSISGLVTTAIKLSISRARPQLELQLTAALGYSFPSGHSSGIAALLTATALHTIEAASSRSQKWVLATFHVITLLAVGLSRIYLGVHYASDVIAGLLLGIACGFLAHGLVRTHLVLDLVRRHRR